jgi:hypothetical protein
VVEKNELLLSTIKKENNSIIIYDNYHNNKKSTNYLVLFQSRRQDSNLRPPSPRPGALSILNPYVAWVSINHYRFRRTFRPETDPKYCLLVVIFIFTCFLHDLHAEYCQVNSILQ